ncbi:FMN-linked oxidoreductase [Ascodesmis nigricans]|uniref:FMN-linked oxidoreductase n=1 Tax=Ascodesmis nigricans TaxID=341454 RepID=A0A4S2MNH3_9PEZI|nr:FMN-linked oxidoreductase [Ascodesmis nigricans]
MNWGQLEWMRTVYHIVPALIILSKPRLTRFVSISSHLPLPFFSAQPQFVSNDAIRSWHPQQPHQSFAWFLPPAPSSSLSSHLFLSLELSTTTTSTMPSPDRPQPANTPAPNTSFFTPHQSPPAGTLLPASPTTPKLFTPLPLRSLTLHNRLGVAPMCTYSAHQGSLTPWHFSHLTSLSLRGPGITIIEATAVLPEGRISPQDSGLWEDGQVAPLKQLAEFFHSQNQKLGIQLAHAGRKASTVAPWLTTERGVSILAGSDIGGWPESVVAPSPIAWDDNHADPRELTVEDIQRVVGAFKAAAKRAVDAGIDMIQIHCAHGYLLHSFLSPVTNKRTDSYGGSFENRVRLLFDVVGAIREVVPETMPLMVRVSATDWLDEDAYPGAWDIVQTVELAKKLDEDGRVDLLDISSGGNHPDQKIAPHSEYQLELAARVVRELGEKRRLKVSAVGGVADGQTAERVLSEGGVDAVFVGRAWLREANVVERFARELGVRVEGIRQYHRRGRWVEEKKPEVRAEGKL